MPWKPPPAAPKCPVCSKSVYAAEQVLGPGNTAYHKQGCFRCTQCGKGLDSTTACDHRGSLLCKPCYAKAHGPKGFGFAGGAAMMHTDSATQPSTDPDQPSSAQQSHNATSATADPVNSVAASFERLATAETKPAAESKPAPASKPRAQFGGAPQCAKCGTSVYAAEKVLAAGGTYHKACLRCVDCGRGLDSSSVNDREGEVYCKPCYAKAFGPKGTRAAMGIHTT